MAQEATDKHNGYVSKTPDLDAIDPSQLSPNAQFGGAVGNWFRYLGRAAWHNIERMMQPGATDHMIFGSAVNAKHYYAENDLQTVFNDISQLSQDAMHAAWNAPGAFEKMTPEQKSKASAEATFNGFFFMGAKAPIAEDAAEQMGLKYLNREQLSNLGIENAVATMKNGERMAFSTDSGIELTRATGDELDSIWRKGWSVRGFEGEGQMGNSGILARNFPIIDDGIFKDGVFTSMKTIDLTAPTYQNMEKLEKRLNTCLEKMAEWNGQEKYWGGRRIDADEVQQKVLQLGVPNGTMTPEQAAVFEQFGKRAKALGIYVNVTAIE